MTDDQATKIIPVLSYIAVVIFCIFMPIAIPFVLYHIWKSTRPDIPGDTYYHEDSRGT